MFVDGLNLFEQFGDISRLPVIQPSLQSQFILLRSRLRGGPLEEKKVHYCGSFQCNSFECIALGPAIYKFGFFTDELFAVQTRGNDEEVFSKSRHLFIHLRDQSDKLFPIERPPFEGFPAHLDEGGQFSSGQFIGDLIVVFIIIRV